MTGETTLGRHTRKSHEILEPGLLQLCGLLTPGEYGLLAPGGMTGETTLGRHTRKSHEILEPGLLQLCGLLVRPDSNLRPLVPEIGLRGF